MVVNYRIVKYCRICRKRFLVNKGESKKIYCEECMEKIEQEQKENQDQN